MLRLKSIIPLALSIITVYLVSSFWHKISLPYENPNEIIGEYSNKNHHQLNDTLRFIFFLFFPALIFLISHSLLNQNKIKPFNKIFFQEEYNIIIIKKNYEKNFYFLIFFIILLTNLFSSNLPNYKLDIFHEGQLLSGALNYNIKNKLWTGSYINTGLFYDILNTKFSWLLFNNESIGTYRMSSFLLNYFFLFFVIILIYKISSIFNLSKNNENYFFIIISIFCFYFYNIKSFNFPNYRDIFTIFFLICLINAFVSNKDKYLNYFLIGSFSITSILWSLDRGIFLNTTIIILIIILFFQRKIFDSLIILLGIFSCWLLFIFVVGIHEFDAFINNSINILRYNEIWNGIIHPQPFSDDKNSTRASKALILFTINSIILTKYIINKNNKLDLNTKLFLGFVFLIGIFYYKVGLSRSDGGHIVIGSSINYILFIILLTYEFLSFQHNKFANRFSNKFDFNTKLLIPLILIIFSIVSLNQKNNYSYENFISFKSRIKNFIKKDDSYFLDKNYQKTIKQLNFYTKNHSCIQNFNYDPTMYYLLKKKSCTQYYLIFNMATKNDQKKFIQQIEYSNLNYLIVDKSYKEYQFSAYNRFPLVKDYIEKNYKIFNSIEKYNILVKIK